ncbi:MAG: hypothetical protein DRN66_03405 [Candidatus Nanohalarchaeota archaeon]|nr:MAG: hypothetical protein DRN66_03405 [Candidatus Nanohaloarchaeota archaeon]
MLERIGLNNKILPRFREVAKEIPYDNDFFDYIYARLILRYLSKNKLEHALKETYRALKSNGKLFVVVRSKKEWGANQPNSPFDKESKMLFYHVYDLNMKTIGGFFSRYFHTKQPLQTILMKQDLILFPLKNIKSNCIMIIREQYLCRKFLLRLK